MMAVALIPFVIPSVLVPVEVPIELGVDAVRVPGPASPDPGAKNQATRSLMAPFLMFKDGLDTEVKLEVSVQSSNTDVTSSSNFSILRR